MTGDVSATNAVRRIRAVVALILLGVGGWATSAHALPGDPPIVALSPADGATVAVSTDPIPVVYKCPDYRSFDDVIGVAGRRSYGLAFAVAPAVGNDGRLLASNVIARDGEDLFQDNDLQPDECRGYFRGTDLPQSRPGTYHWQAWRICVGCVGGYEAGPVTRLVLTRPATATLKINAASTLFGGHAAIVTVKATGLVDGETVRIEAARATGAWRSIGAGSLFKAGARIPVVAKVGETRLRAVVGDAQGGVVVSPVRAVRVSRAVRWASAGVWKGSWRGKSSRFVVSANGRTLTNGRFTVTMLCPTPGLVSPFTIQIGTALVRSARIAPDGTVVASIARTGTAALVDLRLKGRSASGTARLSVGNCTGTANFTATRR